MQKSEIYTNSIVEYTYENFVDFYNDVIHYKGIHHNIVGNSIFRGHSSENFQLIPKVLRLNDSNSFITERYNKRKDTKIAQEGFERTILKRFQTAANFYSLNIPSFNFIEKQNYWEHENFGVIAGLAQHYGLPTRLLDWTHELHTALYFAVTGNKDVEIFEDGDYIVIWALDWFETTFINDNTIGEKLLENLSFITPDYHTNPNLGAQKGVFTFWKNSKNSKYVDKRPLNELILEASKKYYHENDFDEDDVDIILAKFMIHKRNLHEAFIYLTSINWGASKLFPGYEGIVRDLEEKSYFRNNFKPKKSLIKQPPEK